MVSPRRRLERLEEREREASFATGDFGTVFREALTRLSDEDLDALAEALDQDSGLPGGELDFERLYRVADTRSRQGLDALFGAMEAVRKGGRRWG